MEIDIHPIFQLVVLFCIETLNHILLALLLLTEPLDQRREISNRDLEWEIQGREHDSKEDPPACHRRHKRKRTSRNLQPMRKGNLIRIHAIAICISKLPVGARQKAEGDDEREEDDDEDDIGAQGADQVDEAQHAHEDEEEAEGGGEANCSQACGLGVGGSGSVQAVGIVEGLQRCGEGQPEGAEGDENYKGEGVAKDEFEEAADDHEKAAEEIVRSTGMG
jgi:hypothetical protein